MSEHASDDGESTAGRTADDESGSNRAQSAGPDEESERSASAPLTTEGVRRRLSMLRTQLAGLDRATRAVLAITVAALLARLVALGYRVMHFDEARVAYWAYNWTLTGEWHYRYIIHGPFVQHADRWLFAVIGPTDFAARLPVAVVGGLLPAAVLLYRKHFTSGEQVGIALVLAANPILLYYSRFLRSDVLVAAFMFVALGGLVRLYDERDPRYLYLVAGFAALGFAAKENAVVYVVSWLGMVGAVAGMELLYPRRFESRSAFARWVRDRGQAWGEWFLEPSSRGWVGHIVGAGLLLAALTVYFYAPRSPAAGAGFWQAGWIAAVQNTVDALQRGFDHWGGTGVPGCFTGNPDGFLNENFADDTFAFKYLCNLGRELVVLRKAAVATTLLAVVGFVAEWPRDDPRLLVTGAFAWGVASILGYAYGSDIMFPPWLVVHAVVPFAVPAGVGIALFVRWGRDALGSDDPLGAAVSALVVVMLVTTMVGTAAHHAYVAPQGGTSQETNVVQYAQPAGKMQPAIRTLDEVAATNDGVDVLVYGDDMVDMGAIARREPTCVKWLIPSAPVPWYLHRSGADVRCADTPNRFRQLVAETDPPIVIATQKEAHVPRGVLGDEYESAAYRLRLGDRPSRTVVFFFDTEQTNWNETS